MIRWRKRIRRLTYILIDTVNILLAYLIALNLYEGVLGRVFKVSSLELIGLMVLLTVGYIGVFLATNLYDETMMEQEFYSLRVQVKTLVAFAIATGISGSLLFFINVPVQRLFMILFAMSYYGLYMLSKILLLKALDAGFSRNKVDRNILIVGCTPKGRRYIDEINKYEYLSIKIAGYVDIKDSKDVEGYEGLNHLGNIEELDTIAREFRIDEIAVARPLSYDPRLMEMLDECQRMGITVTMLLECRNTTDAKAHVAMVGSVPVLKFHTVSLNESQIFAKRILDVCGALVGMVLFGIAYLFFVPIIKLETPGPAIFKQKRVGKNGRIFEIWKFRSMGVNAEAQKAALMACNEMSGHMFKVSNDPRVTRIGSFLRKTSIDELPQFYNVLRGDMSLVGTRPPTVGEVAHYEQHHHKRISITPGITGMWQISGRSDVTDFEEVVRMDSDYINHWTVWMDIKILVKTVLVVLKKRGSK